MSAKRYNEQVKQNLLEYQRANIRQVKFALSIKYDADVIAHLETVPNIRQYLLSLIRADMATRAKSEPKKEDKPMNNLIPLVSILLNDSDTERQVISYDTDTWQLYSDAEPDVPLMEGAKFSTIDAAEAAANALYPMGSAWQPEWIERDDDTPTQKIICTGYTPARAKYQLILMSDHRLHIVTDDADELFNDEYYDEDELSSAVLFSVKASLLSDGYTVSDPGAEI